MQSDRGSPKSNLKVKVKVKSLSSVRLFATPWTIAHQTPLSIGLPSQEYWSGLPFPSSRDLPDPGLQPMFPALLGRFFTTKPPGKPDIRISWLFKIDVLLENI